MTALLDISLNNLAITIALRQKKEQSLHLSERNLVSALRFSRIPCLHPDSKLNWKHNVINKHNVNKLR